MVMKKPSFKEVEKIILDLDEQGFTSEKIGSIFETILLLKKGYLTIKTDFTAEKMICSPETVFTAENKGSYSKTVLMAV